MKKDSTKFKEFKEIGDKYALYKQLETSNSMLIFKNFLKARSSFLVFLDNGIVVKQTVKFLNTKSIDDLDTNYRWRIQRRLVKDLHNVISSGQSFLDHLKHSHNYTEVVHEKVYAVFFRELRNFLIHTSTFSLVTRREYKIYNQSNIYQAMDKTEFNSFVNKKAMEIWDKSIKDTSKMTSRDKTLGRELMDLLHFLDDRETYLNFEPLLELYINSLTTYYKIWTSNFLKERVKLHHLKNFVNDAEAVCTVFSGFFTPSRIRFLKISLFLKSRSISKS